MGYELIHDTIAKQIFNKASREAQTRRKIEKYIRERHQAFVERGAKLTTDDIEYINPYLQQINISPTEAMFIKRQQKANRRKRNRQIALLLAIILVLAIFSVITFQQSRNIADKNVAIEKQKSEVEQQKQQLENNLIDLLRARKEQTQANYNQYLERGMGLMAQSKFVASIPEFRNALQVLEEYEKEREGISDSIPIAPLSVSSTLADSLILVAQSKSNRKERFEELIKAGDAQVQRGAYSLDTAYKRFQSALQLGYDDKKALARIDNVENLMRTAFRSFVEAANTLFLAEGYDDALVRYQEAANIAAILGLEDDLVLQRIEDCKQRN